MRTILLWSSLCWLAAMGGSQAIAAEPLRFSRDILPILSDNCFHCHGPSATGREGELRLDLREAAMGAGASGAAAIVPGNSAGSEVVRRIMSEDEAERMPPASSNRRLTPRQTELIRRWIDEGAPWGKHWSYEPLQRPAVPGHPNSTWPRNDLDHFVLARLEQEGLQPSPEADRTSLLRRVTLDLTGLPPSVEEIDQFLADPSPQAYERVVDRLLKSPRFGERMAWDWMEASRYADSNGYQGDGERTMWPWRDWVVKAFNDNLPFDQFTLWQLAGDLLPDATAEQKLATGFCRNHPINGEGGRIAEENRVDYVMDMTETMGTVWLGLTLNCSRCHDHKFDPVTRRDYYSLFAFFNQTPVNGGGGNPQTPPVIAVPSNEQQQRVNELEAKVAELRRRLDQRASELDSAQAAWETSKRAELSDQNAWKVLAPTSLSAQHQELRALDDHSVLASGTNPPNDNYTIVTTTDLPEITGLRLEALRHESLTKNSLSRADSGNFVLTEVEVHVQRSGDPQPVAAKLGSAQASFEQSKELSASAAIDGNPKTGWAVYEGRVVDREHEAIFRFASPLPAGAGTKITIVLKHESPHTNHNLGRFRLSATSTAEPKLDPDRDALLAALKIKPQDRTKEQAERVTTAHRGADDAYRQSQQDTKQAQDQLASVRGAIPKVMVMEDQAQHRPTFLLDKGLYNKPQDEVSAATPASLPALPPGMAPNRLALARWLVAKDHPLTPRVTVNRVWQSFFGVGLVKTSEDLGLQGEFPKQPELLEWLAADFRDSGWDVKRLVRSIVTSATYRQSSRVSSELLDRDPENRLLARGPRFRMPSWMLRDSALAASGLLVDRVGGPPVNGYQPAGVWEEATFGNKRYQQDHGESLYRRSLYIFWRRIVGPTVFFDTQSRSVCTVKPTRTNTPLHALTTLNDITFVEAARALAERVLTSASADRQRSELVFRRVLGRSPTDEERSVFLAGCERGRKEYAAHTDQALKLLAVGESKRNEQLDPAEHAAWTTMCLAILNLDEALTKE